MAKIDQAFTRCLTLQQMQLEALEALRDEIAVLAAKVEQPPVIEPVPQLDTDDLEAAEPFRRFGTGSVHLDGLPPTVRLELNGDHTRLTVVDGEDGPESPSSAALGELLEQSRRLDWPRYNLDQPA